LKSIAALLAPGALVLSTLVFAPVASANYAPQLPNRIESGERIEVKVEGAQPGCRVTFAIRRIGGRDNVNRGLLRRTRVAVDQAGVAATSLKIPRRAGRYQLITRVDNFPGQTGCTPTKTVQRINVR